VLSRVLALFFILALLASRPLAFSQNPNPPFPPQLPPGTQAPPTEEEGQAKMEREMAKKVNHDRQVALKRDTDKLLKLATELKQDVDKSSENTLSVDVVKKAEEIEKLAHSVKEKMKGN